MATKTARAKKATGRTYPLISAANRRAIWARVRGMWKGRKPDPIKELRKMRGEWDRKLTK